LAQPLSHLKRRRDRNAAVTKVNFNFTFTRLPPIVNRVSAFRITFARLS
jgi:hypothetical protein